MDNRKDAIGLSSAYDMAKSNYDLMARLDIKNICVAVINRYDQKKESAGLTVTATDILTQVQSGRFVFRISDIKKLCEYLMG